ncbi:hypothetical protein K466DRAFT_477247, partial [Polyporus arcularius HHB13444]
LLTLVVLVQNRRKDGQKGLVLSAQCQLVSVCGVVDDIMKGRVEGDRAFVWQSSGSVRSVICAADDQWNDEGPRLCVTHINGTKVTGSRPPPQVLNATRGILALNPGDYAIVHMQFRVGDGQEISRDWEALCRMRSFRLPAVAPWDGQSPASHELGATALLLSPPRSIGIRAFFDQDATLAYYREILEEGQRAFIESHYGVEQADAWERTCVEGYESAKRMLRLYKELNPLGFAAMVTHDQYTQSESARVSIIQDVDRETRSGRSIVKPGPVMCGAVELHRETYHTEM